MKRWQNKRVKHETKKLKFTHVIKKKETEFDRTPEPSSCGSPHYTESEGSLLHSQQPASCPFPKPA